MISDKLELHDLMINTGIGGVLGRATTWKHIDDAVCFAEQAIPDLWGAVYGPQVLVDYRIRPVLTYFPILECATLQYYIPERFMATWFIDQGRADYTGIIDFTLDNSAGQLVDLLIDVAREFNMGSGIRWTMAASEQDSQCM